MGGALRNVTIGHVFLGPVIITSALAWALVVGIEAPSQVIWNANSRIEHTSLIVSIIMVFHSFQQVIQSLPILDFEPGSPSCFSNGCIAATKYWLCILSSVSSTLNTKER